MKSKRSISIAECVKETGKSADFIRRAIKNRTFPGSFEESENGRASFHIPREAFEDYMTKFHRSVSDELIEALIEKYIESKKRSPSQRKDSQK